MLKAENIYKINIPIYDGIMIVFYDVTHKEYIEYLKLKSTDITEMDSYCKGRCIVHQSGHITLRLRKDCKLETLIHELFHAVFNFLDLKGIKCKSSSDEAFAYLQGYLVNELDKKGLIKKLIK